MARNKKELLKELDKINDTIDINAINQIFEMGNTLENFKITRKTLTNIAKWALDGKSQFEIAQNLELSKNEWLYLCQVCPSILVVMQHSQAYADIVVAGSLYQTAIGGHKIHKVIPMKIKDYEDGRVVGEHVELVEYDEIQPSNPMLLKYLAENKLSENFGNAKTDNSKEHREIIDAMSPDEIKAVEERIKDNG